MTAWIYRHPSTLGWVALIAYLEALWQLYR